MADEKLSNELPDALIDAHLGLAYKSSGLNGMTGESWDRIVARRFFALGMATAAGIIEFPRREPCREHRDLMLTAAADLESWMKSHGKDLATQETVALLRDAACGVATVATVQLEVGRSYLTRNGATVRIAESGVGCFYGDFGPGNQRRRYAPDGRYCGQGALAVDPWDIVADGVQAGEGGQQ